jgi:hypothetical protein
MGTGRDSVRKLSATIVPSASGTGGDDGLEPRLVPMPAALQSGPGGRGTGRAFHPTICPRCSSITLAGIAEGLTIHLDPTPLNATSEAASLVAGRSTWHMTSDREVCWRTASKVAYWPAGNYLTYAVFARHQCHAPITVTITGWCWVRSAATPIPEEPGF